jgi:hypothetical protein
VEQICLWVEVTVGVELDDTGALRPLGADPWNERRQRLNQLGGGPRGLDE